MKEYEIWQRTALCAAPVKMADRFWTRLRGLMLRKELQPGEGLFLKNCAAIHCCFMRFPIDVVYLDRNMTVIGIETVSPWRLGGHFSGARHVLELEKGRGSLLEVGIEIELKERTAK